MTSKKHRESVGDREYCAHLGYRKNKPPVTVYPMIKRFFRWSGLNYMSIVRFRLPYLARNHRSRACMTKANHHLSGRQTISSFALVNKYLRAEILNRMSAWVQSFYARLNPCPRLPLWINPVVLSKSKPRDFTSKNLVPAATYFITSIRASPNTIDESTTLPFSDGRAESNLILIETSTKHYEEARQL